MNGQTIKIDGKEYQALISPDGLRIVTPERAYILRPLCTDCGMPLEDGYGERGQLPPGAPVEIRPRNFRTPYPDWTAAYPQDTARHWKLRQDYIASMTLEHFLHEDGSVGDEQNDAKRFAAFQREENDFEKWRASTNYGGIYWVFHDHATQEQIEAVEGPEMFTFGILAGYGRTADSRGIINKIEWEARYNDKRGSVIYLEHLQEDLFTPEEATWARNLQPAAPAPAADAEKIAAATAAVTAAVDKFSAKVDQIAAKQPATPAPAAAVPREHRNKANASARVKKPRKRGRKRTYNRADDKKLLMVWRDGKANGHFSKYADLAQEKGMKLGDVVRALQRARAVERAIMRG